MFKKNLNSIITVYLGSLFHPLSALITYPHGDVPTYIPIPLDKKYDSMGDFTKHVRAALSGENQSFFVGSLEVSNIDAIEVTRLPRDLLTDHLTKRQVMSIVAQPWLHQLEDDVKGMKEGVKEDVNLFALHYVKSLLIDRIRRNGWHLADESDSEEKQEEGSSAEVEDDGSFPPFQNASSEFSRSHPVEIPRSPIKPFSPATSPYYSTNRSTSQFGSLKQASFKDFMRQKNESPHS